MCDLWVQWEKQKAITALMKENFNSFKAIIAQNAFISYHKNSIFRIKSLKLIFNSFDI